LRIPKKAIEEFRALYRKKFGRELEPDEAKEMATELLNLYSLSQGTHNIL